MKKAAGSDFWQRYTAFVSRRRGMILAAGVGVLVVGAFLAVRLQLRSEFSELLPAQAVSVAELRRVEQRMGGLSSIYVLIEGGDWKERQGFTEEVVAALQAQLPPGQVSHIDYEVKAASAFFERHRLLYADTDDLRTLRDRLRRKVEDERRRLLVVDLEDAPPVSFDVEDLRRKYEARASEYHRFPDGYFITPERDAQAILLRTASVGGEGGSETLVERVRDVTQGLRPAERGYSIRLGGEMVTAKEEREHIVDDLLVVSLSCITLVVLVIVGFYRSLRSLVVIAAPVAVGVAAAFGVAAVAIGHLNSNTAFLGSIIVGNGINFAIIFLARYAEARRVGETAEMALRLALSQTWLGTATAALAASVAYGSLMATGFRGFSQFGFIGGIGMLLCWLATFTVAPALVLVLEARWPSRVRSRPSTGGGAPAWLGGLLRRHHASFTAVGLGLTLLATVVAANFYREPFEYDFSKLRSRTSAERGSATVGAKVDTIFAGTELGGGSRMVVLLDRPEQVAPTLRELERRRAAGAEIARIDHVEALLPTEQPAKLSLLREIRELLDSKVTGWLTPAQREEVRRFRPPTDLGAVTSAGLPELLRRPFTEKNGRLGLVVFVQPKPGAAGYDGRRLLRFAESLRDLTLEDGTRVFLVGADVILSDILRAIVDDGPLATAISLVGVLLLLGFAFRRLRERLVLSAALLVGVAWMGGAAALLGLKVNMLNFVALPITFGVGVDYAVNLYRRYEEEGPGGMAQALWGTGGAVALCSLTTIIGYGSLLFADTRALNSFGLLAVLGELGTLAAALLWMPAVVTWLERWRAKRDDAPPSGAITPPSARSTQRAVAQVADEAGA